MEQRNLLLAIVVSVGILIGFQYLFEKLRPPPPVTPAVPTQTAPASNTAAPGTAAPGAPGTVAPATGAAAPGAETREQAIAEQPRVRINTPRLHGSVALTGGRIDDLTPPTYHETVDPKSPDGVLLWPQGTQGPHFAGFGLVALTP